jgi:hypothetical protein
MPALNTAPAALDDVENAAQRAWGSGNQIMNQQLLRMNAGDQALADENRNNFSIMNQSANAVIVQALLGSDPTLAANILSQRAAGAQPQSGGGPGQPTSFPVQQALPNSGVFVINPQTGAVTKA